MERVAERAPPSECSILVPHCGQNWLPDETSTRQLEHFTGAPPFLARSFYTRSPLSFKPVNSSLNAVGPR